MLMQYQGQFLPPGQLADLVTLEPEFTSIIWGRLEQQVIGYNVIIDGSARDAGNTGYTTTLRPGLLLGKVTSTGRFKQWNPAATDGTQFVAGVLMHAIHTQRTGEDQNRFTGYVLFGGNVKTSGLVIAADTDAGIVGKAEEFVIRNQLSHAFKFDDDSLGYSIGRERMFQPKTANYTVLDRDAGTAFTNTGAAGAVTFTLPTTPKQDLVFWFYSTANQNLIVASASGNNMIVVNDASANSVALQTTNQKIGGAFRVVGTGSAWLVTPMVFPGQTITIAT
jgi:hypothetical protein